VGNEKNKDIGERSYMDYYKSTICPHCKEEIFVRIDLAVAESLKREQLFEPKDWKTGLESDQLDMVQNCKDAGIMDAFAQAVSRSGRDKPKMIESFFLSFLTKARPKAIPRDILRHFITLFPRKTINFWSTDGIGAVLADGDLKMFLPSRNVIGAKVKTLSGSSNLSGKIMATETELKYLL